MNRARRRILHRRMDAARQRFAGGEYTEVKFIKMRDITQKWYNWLERQEA